MFHAQGEQTHFKDYLGVGERTPVADLSDDIHDHPDHSVEYDEASGMVTVFARRPLETTDKTDFVIQLDKPFILGYAYSGKNSDFKVSGKHDRAGTIKVTLASNGAPLFGKMPSKDLCCNLYSGMDYTGMKKTYCLNEDGTKEGLSASFPKFKVKSWSCGKLTSFSFCSSEEDGDEDESVCNSGAGHIESSNTV